MIPPTPIRQYHDNESSEDNLPTIGIRWYTSVKQLTALERLRYQRKRYKQLKEARTRP